MRVPDGDLPEPTVLAGDELPLRPRCFRCGAIRVDYTTRDIKTGEVQEYSDTITTYAMDPDCEHRWSDRIEPVADDAEPVMHCAHWMYGARCCRCLSHDDDPSGECDLGPGEEPYGTCPDDAT